MRKTIVSLCLFCGAAVADTAGPLDRLAAVMPGVWKTEGQTFDSPVSKANAQHYTTRRDCWRDADAYRCVSVVNGTLQLYDTFTWDASANVYHQIRITPQGAQPAFTVSAQGDSWSFDQDVARNDGSVVHLRIIRTYGPAGTASYDETFSPDGKQWLEVAKGTDTRVDAPR